MNRDARNEEIAASLRLLAATYVTVVQQLEQQLNETLSVLSSELNLGETPQLDSLLALNLKLAPADSAVRPVADRMTLSVVYQGKCCFLGNTLLFRFFETIARRPNRYFAHSELLDEVWRGPRTGSSIRNVAKRLRDRLILTKMNNVAEATRTVEEAVASWADSRTGAIHSGGIPR